MTTAYDVLAVYAALLVWAVLLVVGLRRHDVKPFLGVGVLIAVVLNVRYFVEGQTPAIAFFIGIYDVFDNLGLGRTEGAPALATCPDNACTVWGDRFLFHPSWGVACYDRFLDAPALRSNLLAVHIFFNTVVFVLLHVQLWRPGAGAARRRHRIIGRVSFGALTLGTISAVWLASEHGAVGEYGGMLAELGFSSMSAFVFGPAAMSVVMARRGDAASHRIWAIRYAGSMWGSFWLFRVMLVVTGPLLRNWETASILLSIWLSAPLGIMIAEVVRRRREAQRVAQPSPATTAVAAAG